MKKIKIEVAYKQIKYPNIHIITMVVDVKIPITESNYRITYGDGLSYVIRKSECPNTVNNYIRFCMFTRKVVTGRAVLEELKRLIPDEAHVSRVRHGLNIGDTKYLDRYHDNPYITLKKDCLLVREVDVYDIVGKILTEESR